MRNRHDVQALALVVQRVVAMTIARSLQTQVRTDLRDAPLPDLVAGVVNDMRELVEAQVGLLVDLGATIKSWLIALCVAIVTAMLLGLALAATLTQLLGIPWYAALWLVTALAVGAVVALVYRARATGRKAAVDNQDVLATGSVPAHV
jgi:hypothetical protein